MINQKTLTPNNNNAPDSRLRFRIVFSTIIFLSLACGIYVSYSNFQQLLNNDAHIFDVRKQNLQSHASLIKTNLLALKASMHNNIIMAEQGLIKHQKINHLTLHPDMQLYLASDLDKTLIVYQQTNQWSDSLRNQLTASQALLPTLKQVLQNIDNSLWIYYVSKEGFSFVTPEIPDIPSKERTYLSVFWQQAIPANNPNSKMIVTDAYEDYFSKTLVITIAVPISVHDEFVGVIGFDVGINALTSLSQLHKSVGQTYIVDNRNSVISLKDQILDPSIYKTNEPQDAVERVTGKLGDFYYVDKTYWNKKPIFNEELYAFHVIELSALLREAIYKSISEYVAILFTTLLLIFFLVRLRVYSNAITELSNADPLTGLLNRRAMKEIAEYQVSMCHRNKRPISIVMLDIDHFKRFNDKYGHEMGDIILKSFAEMLRQKTRANDVLCRYGGEEFVICLPELSSLAACKIIERFKTLNITSHARSKLPVYFSAGVAQISPDETLEEAIKRADQALLRAKKLGRNRIEISLF